MLLSFTAFLLVLSPFLSISVAGEPTIYGPFPNGVPGSGYGCDNTCSGGDRDYVIEARIETYNIPNSGQVDNPQKLSPDNDDIAYKTRTFVGTHGNFCRGDDGSNGPLGPCLVANPGETVKIKIINKMDNGMEEFNQVPADEKEFFKFISSIGPGILPGVRANAPEELKILSEENLPGVKVSFDDTNLHVHGLHVVPHMFHPMGTSNPNADWITIKPGAKDPNAQCYCYVFDIPTDHPQGTFFWHIHRHGSTSMQGWQGMAGLLFIGDESNPGSPFQQLDSQGVTRSEPLFFWEFMANVTNVFPTGVNPNTLAEGQYIEIFMNENNPNGQQFFYPVNNMFFPSFSMTVNEIVYFPTVNAQTSAGVGLYIMDEGNNLVPFYRFASDGYTFGPGAGGISVYEHEMLILGPSQREGLLFQFAQPGKYFVMNHRITPTQRNGAFQNGYSDQTTHLAATIDVVAGSTPFVDPLTFSFSKGVTLDIELENIVRHTTVTFDIDIQQDSAPFAQFEVNNKLYETKELEEEFDVLVDKAERWTVNSANEDVSHPFHIHVNPFIVTGIDADSVVGELKGIPIKDTWIQSQAWPANLWRDTVFVPPKGSVDLTQQFGGELVAFRGKTVFHCHYLEHEDQGMMKNLRIDNTTKFCVNTPEKCFTNSDCCDFLPMNSPTKCFVNSNGVGRCCKKRGVACSKDADCCNQRVTNICRGGVCVMCKSNGAKCSKNNECCSRNCNQTTKKCRRSQ